MNFPNNCNLSFLDLLESMLDSNYNDNYVTNNSNSYENELICRGLPETNSETRKELSIQIQKKQKRKTLIENIDLLKNLIKEKKEEESLIHLAKIINEVTTEDQKLTFINELQSGKKMIENTNNEYNGGYVNLIPRSTAPESYKNDSLTSFKSNSNFNSNHLDKSISGDQQYLVHKGIHYCRTLLSKFFHEKNNNFLKELISRNIIHYVLNEQIDGQNSYLMDLVEHYPLSYQEILFILKEDEDIILDSPIFVLLAERNVKHLYEFLSKLSNERINKNKLSQSCAQSSFNGSQVCHIIRKNKNPEESVYCVKIETFLNRYKHQKNC